MCDNCVFSLHTMAVQEPWFSMIPKEKTVEGRAAPVERYSYIVGRELIILCKEDPERMVTVVITAVRHYPTLDKYLEKEWEKAAPQAASFDEAKKMYLDIWKPCSPVPTSRKIQVFSPERVEERGGMCAIEFVKRPEVEQYRYGPGWQPRQNRI